ncbi:hypothetical protein [Acidovorax sp. RAC01]|uniref:hypothetical protein n=1 Tax=Acidovorax sp. RAC01 TaxID=1842533 RepID=UPI00083E7EB0|nr:hypothetical protein [Acidovorax sp. RAC01]AOG22034.1 putative membrane protein [Acidovorax sp. RAC01]
MASNRLTRTRQFVGGVLIAAVIAFVLANQPTAEAQPMACIAQPLIAGLMIYLFFASLGLWLGRLVMVVWILIGIANGKGR